jgi:hypothetical protein
MALYFVYFHRRHLMIVVPTQSIHEQGWGIFNNQQLRNGMELRNSFSLIKE